MSAWNIDLVPNGGVVEKKVKNQWFQFYEVS